MTKIPFRCTAEATPNVSTFCERLVCFLGSPSSYISPPGLFSYALQSAVFWYGQHYSSAVLLLVRSSYAVGKASEINNWIGKYYWWVPAKVSQVLAWRLFGSDQGIKSPKSEIDNWIDRYYWWVSSRGLSSAYLKTVFAQIRSENLQNWPFSNFFEFANKINTRS